MGGGHWAVMEASPPIDPTYGGDKRAPESGQGQRPEHRTCAVAHAEAEAELTRVVLGAPPSDSVGCCGSS
jgi:hypothetical protein